MNRIFKEILCCAIALLLCTSCSADATDLSDFGAKASDAIEVLIGTSDESRYVDEETSVMGGDEIKDEDTLADSEDEDALFALIPDETLADLANLSYTAEQGDDVPNWDGNIKEVFIDESVRFKCVVFENEDSIVYAFRGTPFPSGADSDTFKDWWQTLSYYLPPDNSLYARQAQYDALRERVIDRVIPLIEETEKNVYITGHSLGGWLSLETFMIANERLSTTDANKIKVVATFNTIGISQSDGRRIRDFFSLCDTTVKNFYVCCDIARWYGKENGFDFPGNNFVIDGSKEYGKPIAIVGDNVGHFLMGVAHYRDGDVYGHVIERSSDELLKRLGKVKEYISPLKTYFNSRYVPSVDLPSLGDSPELQKKIQLWENVLNFAALDPETQNAITEMGVRIDAHGHYQGLLKYSVEEDF